MRVFELRHSGYGSKRFAFGCAIHARPAPEEPALRSSGGVGELRAKALRARCGVCSTMGQHRTKKAPIKGASFCGDSWENRTPVSALRGPCLSRLTNEPYSLA